MFSLGCALKQSCREPFTIPTPHHEGGITTIARAIHERVITLERNLGAADTRRRDRVDVVWELATRTR